jgi:beta-glucosidase
MSFRRAVVDAFAKWRLALLLMLMLMLMLILAASAKEAERIHVQSKDEERVQRILSRMSVNDKIGQMAQVDINVLCEDDPNESGKRRLSDERVRTVIGENGVGSVLNYIQGRPFTPHEMRQATIQIQEVAKNYSRPPVIWGLDSVHGANYVHGAVVTPQPINIAATFNTSFAYAAGQLSSRDTRAVGINWLFAPLMGIAIEPRWSRVYETFGEDPTVVALMGAQFIAGIQERSRESNSTPSAAAACAKHFVGYSSPHTGHDRAPSWIPTRHLYQYFLPPWRKAMEQNVLTVMESYTEIDGVPNVANPNTLRYLLRQQLGFEGVLVTDYQEILNLNNFHHISRNDNDAVVHSLREGSVDMSMIPHSDVGFRDSINQGIANGTLFEERIHHSAERVLHLKAKLNMFQEEVTMDNNADLDKIGQQQDVQDSLDMASQSIVLVKNEMATLPLARSKDSPTILMTGPTINSLVYQTGGWTGEWQGVPLSDSDKYFTYGATVLDAMTATFSKQHVKYTCGVDILGRECEDPSDDEDAEGVVANQNGVMDQVNDVYGTLKSWAGFGQQEPSNSMEKAAKLAATADFVVIGIGEEAYAEKPGDLPDRSMDLAAVSANVVGIIAPCLRGYLTCLTSTTRGSMSSSQLSKIAQKRRLWLFTLEVDRACCDKLW